MGSGNIRTLSSCWLKATKPTGRSQWGIWAINVIITFYAHISSLWDQQYFLICSVCFCRPPYVRVVFRWTVSFILFLFFFIYLIPVPWGNKQPFKTNERLCDSDHSWGSMLLVLFFFILLSHIINRAFLYQRWSAGSIVFIFRRFKSDEMSSSHLLPALMLQLPLDLDSWQNRVFPDALTSSLLFLLSLNTHQLATCVSILPFCLGISLNVRQHLTLWLYKLGLFVFVCVWVILPFVIMRLQNANSIVPPS